MNTSCRHRTARNETGVAIAELALILPLLLLIGLAALELIRTSTIVKAATQLSREAANVAYRECVSRTNDAQEMLDCLTLCQRDVENRAQRDLNGAVAVILSYYTTNTATPPILTKLAGVGGTTLLATRFSPSNGTIGSGVTALQDQPIIISEVYVPFTSVIRTLLSIWRYEPGFIYDATVL